VEGHTKKRLDADALSLFPFSFFPWSSNSPREFFFVFRHELAKKKLDDPILI